MSAFARSDDTVEGAFHIVESKKLNRFVLAQILSGDMDASSSVGRICHYDFTCAQGGLNPAFDVGKPFDALRLTSENKTLQTSPEIRFQVAKFVCFGRARN
jgi:hypothetical protein